MNLFSQINLLEHMHFHIEHKSTGRPGDFARKLQISERSMYRVLEVLNDRGIPIAYSRLRLSFVYTSESKIPELFKDRIKK